MENDKLVNVQDYLEKEKIGIATLVHRIKQGLQVFINPSTYTKKRAGRKGRK
jgi:hypothetical protein